MTSVSRLSSDGLRIRPFLEITEATQLVENIFGFRVFKAEELPSYDDRNFLIKGHQVSLSETEIKDAEPNSYRKLVFKLMNSRDTYSCEFLDAVVSAMQHFERAIGRRYRCPVPVSSLNGSLKVFVDIQVPENEILNAENALSKHKNTDNGYLNCKKGKDGKLIITMKHYARLLSFVPGEIFPGGDLNEDILLQAGKLAANVIKTFKDFKSHALITKQDLWDMKNLLELRDPQFLEPIKDPVNRNKIKTTLDLFEENVISVISELPMQTIHSDLNEQNIIVQTSNGRRKITGLIDFGDITYTCRVFEISTCMMYLGLLKSDDFIWVTGTILAGYLSEEKLTPLELDVLYYCTIGRLAMSLVMGNYQYSQMDSANDYLLITSKTGWNVLDTMLKFKDCKDKIVEMWLSYCTDEIKHFYKQN